MENKRTKNEGAIKKLKIETKVNLNIWVQMLIINELDTSTSQNQAQQHMICKSFTLKAKVVEDKQLENG